MVGIQQRSAPEPRLDLDMQKTMSHSGPTLNSCSQLQQASQRMQKAVEHGKVESMENWNDVNFTH